MPISRWLLGEALRPVAAWSRDRAELTVAVNIAAQHLSVGTLVDDVTEALELAGVRPQQLIVELTESNVAQTGSPGAPQRVAPSDWQSAAAGPLDAVDVRRVRCCGTDSDMMPGARVLAPGLIAVRGDYASRA